MTGVVNVLPARAAPAHTAASPHSGPASVSLGNTGIPAIRIAGILARRWQHAGEQRDRTGNIRELHQTASWKPLRSVSPEC